MRRFRSCPWLLCVLLCACDCNSGKPPAKHEQQAAQPEQELPGPGETLLAGERLRAFFPDTIAGYVAPAPAAPQTLPMANGGSWTIMRRKYEQDGKTLTLEVSDVLHAPGARRLIESQQGANRSADRATFRGAPISGQPALIQWHGDQRMAIVNILISGRVLMTVKVEPADTSEPAAIVANALPLEQFAQLALAASAEESVPAQNKPGSPAAQAPANAEPAQREAPSTPAAQAPATKKP